MFRSARIKLTAWYLLIIMLVSVSFSVAMYRVLTSELDRLERVERVRIEHRLPGGNLIFLDPDLLEETKSRVKLILILINLIILAGSAYAGYILAGRTLNPIAEMVDEQNRFITDASHELRTPLTSLKSEIEVNLRDPDISLDQAKSLLKSNLEEVNSLQVLSDGLIRLTQYSTRGGSALGGQKGQDVSLEVDAKEAIRKVTNAAKEKKITIANDIHNTNLQGNRTALTELLVIFLDNAIKYSQKQKTIHLTGRKSDGKIIIEITDQGFGIDEKDIPHLFDRFYRADKSRTKTGIPGYGLGLSIARQIIDQHNGTIRVHSELKKGTTFTVELPIKHSRNFV
ncbi:MAG: HAMP domain-containing sensor histidine kinase [Candidatus Gottesmanbacteria bacterium]|nr:HAMP domain-containing sensor histidine kinase [Candidatus Gottesmanbacteria bacterium]